MMPLPARTLSKRTMKDWRGRFPGAARKKKLNMKGRKVETKKEGT